MCGQGKFYRTSAGPSGDGCSAGRCQTAGCGILIYILDTNANSPAIVSWLLAQSEEELYLSVVILGQIERGIRLQEKGNPDFARSLRGWLGRMITPFGDRVLEFSAHDNWPRLADIIERCLAPQTKDPSDGLFPLSRIAVQYPAGQRIKVPSSPAKSGNRFSANTIWMRA